MPRRAVARLCLVGVALAVATLASTPAASVGSAVALDDACEIGAAVDPLAPATERVKRPGMPGVDPQPPLPQPLTAPEVELGTRALTGASAVAPSLVQSFGQGGKVTTNLSYSGSSGNGVALQPDGKIVVAGSVRVGANWNFAIVRYLPSGRLDATFGAGGTVVTDFGGEDAASAVSLERNGAIVVAGWTKTTTTRAALARYTPSGALDRSFGTDGKVVTSFTNPRGGESGAVDVAVQPDGKIVVAGYALGSLRRTEPNLDLAVARFTTRGALDSSFGARGVATVDFAGGADVARGVVLQRSRQVVRIVVAGYSVKGSSVAAAVARLRPNGTLDTGFGAQGRVTTSAGFLWRGWEAIAVQPDGKIVVAGWGSNCVDSYFSVARYTASGAPDSGFGAGGTVETSPGGATVPLDMALDIALLPDGRILAAGAAAHPSNLDFDYAVVRYRANGSLDTQRRGSPAIVVVRPTAVDDVANALTVQPNGRIVLATRMYSAASRSYEVAAARVTPGGILDSSFGSGGLAITAASAHADAAYDVAVQPDGAIVVAGTARLGFTLGVAVRYRADGARDAAFSPPPSIVRPAALALLGNGMIATVGECCGSGAVPFDSAIGARYAADSLVSDLLNGIGGHPSLQQRAGFLGMAALPGGKVVAAGFVETAGNSDFALVRWDQERRRDPSFGGSGTVTTAIGSGNERAAAIAVQPDGKVVVAGFTNRDGTEDFALLRYLDSGQLDPAFGAGGIVVTPIGGGQDRATSVALQADGRIVVAGWTRGAAGADVAIVRHLPDGTLDPTFGSGGKAVFALAPGDDTAADVMVRGDGVIIVAATAGTGVAADFAVARITPDGGTVETTRTDFSGGEDVARALAPMPDGSVVVVGSAHSARWDHDFALARYSVP